MIKIPIPGNGTLEQLKFTCGEIESLEFCKLVRLSKMAVVANKKRNLGDFEETEGHVPDLVFVKVPSSGQLPAIIVTQLAAGKRFLFKADVFIEDGDAVVAVFR